MAGEVHDMAADELQRALEAVGTPPTVGDAAGDVRAGRWGADAGIGGQAVQRLGLHARGRGVPQHGSRRVPGGHAKRVPQHRPYGAEPDRLHRASGQLGQLLLDPQHRDDLRVDVLRPKATGPFVIEPPKQSLCVVDDFWFRYVADMGIAGPDKGEGGKYLFLPPGYDGEVPDGYYVCRPPTFTNWVVFRALGGVPAMKETKVYPLSAAAEPPAVDFVNIADFHFNTRARQRLLLLRGSQRHRARGADHRTRP